MEELKETLNESRIIGKMTGRHKLIRRRFNLSGPVKFEELDFSALSSISGKVYGR